MNRDTIRSSVLASLAAVAPEADPGALAPNADLREELDIDSMDFLRFVVGLHERLHVDIPERDYAKVRTLDACVSYLASRLDV
ncbi:MAG TPA: acyl carrier protein [Labilithrix sp.]|nr:acyl carrier protein [Labilithrix sp.]